MAEQIDTDNTKIVFADWLLEAPDHIGNFPGYLDSFVKVLNGFGLEIIRCNLGVRALHPQIEAIAWMWSDFSYFHEPVATNTFNISFYNLGDAVVIENTLTQGAMSTEAFHKSPIPRVALQGETYSFRYSQDTTDFEFPILEDLLVHEPTHYLAMPLAFGPDSGFSSFVSRKPGGLTTDDEQTIRSGLRYFGLRFHSYLQHLMTDNLLRLYLGEQAGRKVMAGQVHRGDVDTIESVVWFSDIRDYTGLMTRHNAKLVINWLNDYFEGVIGAIRKYNGEVLKFIGDGLLAVFPVEGNRKARQMQYHSLLCARDAGRFLRKLNDKRAQEGDPPLKHGIGLHYGKVEYGNIGAGSRLDFTVVGPSVNTAARIAGLCGRLESEVLMSEELAGRLSIKLESLGKHKLKGIQNEQPVYRLNTI